MLLLLTVCISSCNKDGVATLVIEDGQPGVSQMIIGQWEPDHIEWTDKDGNVLERPEMTDVPDLIFNEGGTGTFEGNGTGSFDWSVDEGFNDGMGSGYDGEGPSITFNGERWYIFQLTKTILIIYRITDRYIIIYYYYRVGEYDGGNKPNENPSLSTVHRISMIETDYNSSLVGHIYTFTYDTQGRIQGVEMRFENEKEYTYKISYTYSNDEVDIITNYGNYKGILNENGYVETLLQQSITNTEWTVYSSISYNVDGQMSMFNKYVMDYLNGDLISVSSEEKNKYNFTYSDIENKTIPDLNSFISVGYLGVSMGSFQPFALPELFGKPSKHLLASQKLDFADYYDEYEYKIDEQGRVVQIICISINRFSGDKNIETTYNITYK